MDDTIYRREALDAVTDELDMIDHVPQWVFDRLEKRLKQLPAAQPEPSQVARDIATIIENEKDMRVIASAQPERTDCEYCHEDSDGFVRPIEKNSHAWLVRRGKTMKLHISFKGEYRECDVLFCPMCGRDLLVRRGEKHG